jgi:large subunit ribosomal protein L28
VSRVCSLSGKGVLYGNHVSHANNKTRRRFVPNLQNVSFLSDALGIRVKARLSTNAVRSIEKNGGLDAYLLKSSEKILSGRFRKMKRTIEKKVGEKNSSTA